MFLFREEILYLITLRQEGEYWDFKKECIKANPICYTILYVWQRISQIMTVLLSSVLMKKPVQKENTLMIFERHANLKYKFGNRQKEQIIKGVVKTP